MILRVHGKHLDWVLRVAIGNTYCRRCAHGPREELQARSMALLAALMSSKSSQSFRTILAYARSLGKLGTDTAVNFPTRIGYLQ